MNCHPRRLGPDEQQAETTFTRGGLAEEDGRAPVVLAARYPSRVRNSLGSGTQCTQSSALHGSFMQPSLAAQSPPGTADRSRAHKTTQGDTADSDVNGWAPARRPGAICMCALPLDQKATRQIRGSVRQSILLAKLLGCPRLAPRADTKAILNYETTPVPVGHLCGRSHTQAVAGMLVPALVGRNLSGQDDRLDSGDGRGRGHGQREVASVAGNGR